jgi:multisubunit Na+/H+ antiporter MnhG subunit
MSTSAVVDAFLAVAVVSGVFGALGVLLMGDPYERLHYLAAPATVGAFALAGAVIAQEGFGQAGFTALLIVAVMLFVNAVLSHATARAARVRQHGSWTAMSDAGPDRGRR